MPRISPEGRSAAAFLTGVQAPEPPINMPPAEAKLWREIVQSKPIGWFDAGSLLLLDLYAYTAIAAGRVAAAASAVGDIGSPAAGRLCRRLVALNTSALGLASRLRLTPQNTIHRRSGLLSEPGAGSPDPLLGGRARGH